MGSFTHLPERPGIYQIINTTSQKRYIGYASNIRSRIKDHDHDLVHSKHPNDYLQKAWLKYGRDHFTYSVLQECSKEQLCLMEDYWVKVLRTTNEYFGYNIRDTDPNGTPGHTEATKEKLRNAGTGRSRFGKDNHFFGHKITEENKEKMRKSREHIDFTKLHREKRGKLILHTLTGIFYTSIVEVVEISGIPKYELSRRISGRRKNNTNFIFA